MSKAGNYVPLASPSSPLMDTGSISHNKSNFTPYDLLYTHPLQMAQGPAPERILAMLKFRGHPWISADFKFPQALDLAGLQSLLTSGPTGLRFPLIQVPADPGPHWPLILTVLFYILWVLQAPVPLSWGLFSKRDS